MRKLEYTLPLMDLLMILKEKLNRIHFVFVVGYSFRDNQIRQIFWNAAKKNKELILILVSPSAHKVYEERLRNYETGIPSELEGRVICLPYKFEKALHLLKNVYLKELKTGLNQERGCNEQENRGAPNAPWESCVVPFINCEYVDKIEWIMQKGAWENYIHRLSPDYQVRTAFKAFLTSLISNDISYKSIWVRLLDNSLSKIIDVNKLNVDITSIRIEEASRSRTERGVSPTFKFADATFDFNMCSKLIQFMQQECQRKISLMKEEQKSTLAAVKNKLDRIQGYFDQFPQGKITLSKYLEKRSKRYPNLETKMYAKDKHGNLKIIPTIFADTEKQELEEIFGGSKISFSKN